MRKIKNYNLYKYKPRKWTGGTQDGFMILMIRHEWKTDLSIISIVLYYKIWTLKKL